jgi:ABC-type multidrug transport system ATPase subunit
MIYGRYFGLPRNVIRERAEELLAFAQLTERRKDRVDPLSGGMKRRLTIARALINKPEVVLLDEPTTGLDPQARLAIWEVVETFRKGGGTTILTTHYMEEAAKLCDRVAIVDHGKIIALGTPAELVASLGADRIVELVLDGDIDVTVLESLPGVARHHRKGATHVLSVRELAETLPALLAALGSAGVRLETMTTHEPTLEDVFVQRTGRALRDE